MIFIYCLLWNAFIWALIAALVAFKDFSIWWFVISFVMTTFPGDTDDFDDDDPAPEEKKSEWRTPPKDGPGGPPLAGA